MLSIVRCDVSRNHLNRQGIPPPANIIRLETHVRTFRIHNSFVPIQIWHYFCRIAALIHSSTPPQHQVTNEPKWNAWEMLAWHVSVTLMLEFNFFLHYFLLSPKGRNCRNREGQWEIVIILFLADEWDTNLFAEHINWDTGSLPIDWPAVAWVVVSELIVDVAFQAALRNRPERPVAIADTPAKNGQQVGYSSTLTVSRVAWIWWMREKKRD